MRSRRSRLCCWGSSAAIPPTLGGRTFLVQTCSVAVSPASADHAKFWLGVMRSPSGMSDGLACYSSSDSLSPPNRKPPTIVVGGSTVLFGWCGRWGRTGSVSDASWLGGRDAHLPAGATALAALDRRGDIVHREFPISAARAAGRGVGLHVRHVGGLDPPQGLECGPGLRPELGGDELERLQGGELPHPIPERVHTASANLGGGLQQLHGSPTIPVLGDRRFCDSNEHVSGRGTRGRRRHSRESAGPHGAAVDPLHVSGDDQV